MNVEWGELYREHHQRIVRAVRRHCNTDTQADDAAHDAWATVATSQSLPAEPLAWVTQAAKRNAQEAVRARKRESRANRRWATTNGTLEASDYLSDEAIHHSPTLGVQMVVTDQQTYLQPIVEPRPKQSDPGWRPMDAETFMDRARRQRRFAQRAQRLELRMRREFGADTSGGVAA